MKSYHISVQNAVSVDIKNIEPYNILIMLKSSNKNKKNTTKKLAGMIRDGFREMVTKHEFGEFRKEVNQKFLNLESDILYLKARVMEITHTLERHEEILEEHTNELKAIHKILDSLTDTRSKNRAVDYQEYSKLESRVSTLEKKISEKIG